MTEPRRNVYEFGEFRLDAGRSMLTRIESGEVVELTPKSLELLGLLVERAGELVEKQTLLDALWPHVIVEENNLSQAVSALRRALGEGPRDHRYLATVQGRGYRFVADVDTVGQPDRRRQVRLAPGLVVALIMSAIAVPLLVAYLTLNTPVEKSEPSTARIIHSERVGGTNGSHAQPAFSPEGNRIVFVSDASGTPQLYVRHLGRGSARKLTEVPGGASMPSWSARDDQIVFQAGMDGIWSVDPLGTLEPRRLIDSGTHPALSADGQRIVYERDLGIWTALADGSGAAPVEGVRPAVRVFAGAYPAFSPDSRFIAYFQQARGPLGDYWLIPSKGGMARRLTDDLQWGGRPTWAPDGRSLIVPSRRGGTLTLWRIHLDGRAPEPLTAGLGLDREPALSLDGRKLLYTSTRVESLFMVTELATLEESILYRSRRGAFFPRPSPDGERITFFAEMEPREQIMLMDADGSRVRQLTDARADEANIMPRWSHDGASIVYYQELPPASLRRLDLAGGPSRTVMPEFSWEHNMDAEPGPFGDRLAFVRVEPGTRVRRVVVRRLDGGAETVLDEAIQFSPSWSDDGTRLLGTNRRQIVICPVNGASCRVVVDASELRGGFGFEPGPDHSPIARWAPDRSRIFFDRVVRPPSQMSLWSVDTDGGDLRFHFEFGPVHPLARRFELLPENRVIWVRYDQADAQLVLATLSRSASGGEPPTPGGGP